jgi:hypothetical protein
MIIRRQIGKPYVSMSIEFQSLKILFLITDV